MKKSQWILLAVLGMGCLWADDLYTLKPETVKQNGVTVETGEKGESSLKFVCSEKKSNLYCPQLPAETLAAMNGKELYLTGEVDYEDISAKPKPWNGVKLMFGMTFKDGKTNNSQANIPTGCSDDWKRFNVKLDLRNKELSRGILVIGLEEVGGIANFRDVRITDAPVK